MAEKLVQIRIDKEIKERSDKVFNSSGITTQVAIKMFLMQVAKTGETPFDDLFM
ncbi:type II toxin-antitoxin system RelB/DinJ family antitoxin [Weissella muntiaci]|uniref:Type II toxin-antitoxin system RelB/DinJ family antitoxin n=1 Tax=Weissella muntiaci TaxID=2508881 RepID=A0A6C2CA02_9LACO|nr:type II toxin-antitoxin system RelB/DinJ family antitoxin [Weissella muntiaci]TYC49875.1 type II toxin-antitoxin system RelB/DinJ family antitoxin [Weissella muntiaci]